MMDAANNTPSICQVDKKSRKFGKTLVNKLELYPDAPTLETIVKPRAISGI